MDFDFFTLIILRGLPGSGKSYLARQLVADNRHKRIKIYSTDDWFVDYITQQYNFDPKKLGIAHAVTLTALVRDMISLRQEIYILDNTNMQKWEFMVAKAVAQEKRFNIKIMMPETEWAWNVEECAKRTVHKVPIEIIQAMKDRYEVAPNIDSV